MLQMGMRAAGARSACGSPLLRMKRPQMTVGPILQGGGVPRMVFISVRGIKWWGPADKGGKEGGKGGGKAKEKDGNRDRDKEKDKEKGEGGGDGPDEIDAIVPVPKGGGGPNDAITNVGAGDHVPRHPHVLALPIERKPFFPGLVQAVMITNPKVFEAISSVKQDYGHFFIGCFLRTDQPPEGTATEVITDLSQIHPVGVLTQVQNAMPMGMGGQVVLVSHRRIRIDGPISMGPPARVKVNHLEGKPYEADSMLIKALSGELVSTIRELIKIQPAFKEHFNFYTQKIDIADPFKLADFAATLSDGNATEMQEVLEELDAEKRLNKVLLLLKKELDIAKVRQEIQQEVEAKLSQNQRNWFMMEQYKTLKKQLGLEKDDKEALLTKYKDRIKDLEVPKAAKQAIDEEMEKLEALEKNSSEFNVTRNYLDWLTSLPWGVTSEENFDLKRAKEILDEDHYGLQDIKDRILEFMAVSKLKGSTQGKILCFVGPPGVGKTSIGKSIARALNREFYRFSVGGLYDVAEIKGHRRTYVGAMPGKIIQCLKTVGTSNPLVLIDEVDKLGRDRGDPASALLELLDPGQNESFIDHYLDVPVDLSKVLFICTANVVETIPAPLQDRMEIIRLSGYDLPEKIAIAQQYLIPKARTDSGIAHGSSEAIPESLSITEAAIDSLVRWYCREAGVRNLEKHIEKICRKLALEVIHRQEGQEEQVKRDDWAVSEDNLDKYVGKRIFTSDRLYEEAPPAGVIMGLSWTAMGGASLYIEVQSVRHKQSGGGTLATTGQMGNVMEESTRIAHTFARRKLEEHEPDNAFFENHDIHMHVPEGAIPKEGPSAGITMTTALLSLAMNKPVRPDIAMTGEISLTGKVLPVGGIKEKTIAARRSGVTCLVFPVGNKRDFDELPEYLREGLEVHFAAHYDDVFKVAFSDAQVVSDKAQVEEKAQEATP